MSFTLPCSRFSVRVQVLFAVRSAVTMFDVDTGVTKQLGPLVNTNREHRTTKSELKG